MHVRAGLVDEAVVGVIRGLATSQGADARARRDIDHAITQLVIDRVLGYQEYLGRRQHGARAQVDGSRRLNAEIDIVAALAIRHRGRVAHHNAGRADIIQARSAHADLPGAAGRWRAVGEDLNLAVGDIARPQHHGAAVAALGRAELAGALELECIQATVLRQGQLERFRIGWQLRAGNAARLRIGQGEGGIACFVVLGVGAQDLGRREYQLAGQRRADVRAGNRQGAGRGPGTVAQLLRQRACAALARQAVQFHAEGARQQGIGRGHQRVGAGGQARHAIAYRHLPAHGRIGCRLVSARRRLRRLHARHDGVHRVGRQARQDKTTIRAHLHQRMIARIGGAAAAGDETGARQFAAAGQVEQRARPHVHGHAGHFHADAEATLRTEAAHAQEGGQLAVHVPALAIDGTAIRHDQAGAADGGDATWQQIHRQALVIVIAGRADRQAAQRCAHHATVLDMRCAQLQRAEGGIRHGRHAVGRACNGQAVRGVIAKLTVDQAITGAHGGASARFRIQLGRTECHVARRGEHCRGLVAIPAQRGQQEAQVAAAAQAHVVGDDIDQAAHVDQVARHADLPGDRRFSRTAWRDIEIAPGRLDAGQAHIRRRHADLRAGRTAGRQHRRTVQLEALLHLQRHVAIEGGGAEQGQVGETARVHLLHGEAAMAILQHFLPILRSHISGQVAGDLLLRQPQLASLQHPGLRQLLAVFGRARGHGQGAARRARAARPGQQLAIEVQAIVRRQRDAAARAGHVDGRAVHTVHVKHGVRAGSVEHGAVAHDDKQAGRRSTALRMVDLAADADAAAIDHLAVAPALHVGGRDGARRHVEHGILADPDGTAMAGRFHRLGDIHVDTHAAQADLATPGVQAPFHRQLAHAGQLDGLARIDIHHGILANQQFSAGHIGRAGLDIAHLQGQAGALALRQGALQWVFRVLLWRPQGQFFIVHHAQHGHAHVDLRAVRYRQALLAEQAVAGKTLVEEVSTQLQGAFLCGIGLAEQYLVRLQFQLAAARHAVAAHLRALAQQQIGLRAIAGQGYIAALATLLFRLCQDARTRTDVDQAAIADAHVANRAQGHAAAIDIWQAGGGQRVAQHIGQQAAGVQGHAIGQHQLACGAARNDEGIKHAQRADLVQHIAGRNAAAMAAQAGVQRQVRAEQGDIAAVSHLQRAVDRDRSFRRDADGAQLLLIQQGRIKQQLALALRCQGACHVEAGGDAVLHARQAHLVHDGRQHMLQHARALVEHRLVLAHDQLAPLRGRQLRLLVAVEQGLRRLRLALALEDLARDAPLQHGRPRGDDQLARVAAHRVAVFQALLRGDQGIGVKRAGILAPARVFFLVTLVHARIRQVGRRAARLVQLAVRAFQPGLAQRARLHVQGAARQVDAGAGLRDDILAAEGDRAALRHPLADGMALRAQVAGHFQQAARRVPAVAVIAVRALRYQHQLAAVDPDIVVEQGLAVAVDGRVALLVALHIDFDIVRRHRHLHAHGAGDVELGAVAHEAAAGGVDGDLAACGQGQRVAHEFHRAGAADLDARLVAAVVHGKDIFRRRHGRAAHGVALAVERRRLAVVLDQDGRGGAASHGDGRVAAQGIEVNGAARGRRGGSEQHAVLLHRATGQGDIAFARLDQARVDDLARRAGGRELRRDFAAARARQRVAIRAHAFFNGKTVAGGQQGLALGRIDFAPVVDFFAQQHHITAAFRAALGHIAGQARARLHLHLAGRIGQRRGAGRAGAVDAILLELRVADAGCGRHQAARIDLARAGKHNAVAVDQQHRAVRLDLALDLAGTRLRIVDPVQHGPVLLLLEGQGRVFAHVKRFPVQDGLVRRLLHHHGRLAVRHCLHGRLGIEPAGRQAVGVDLQAALHETIRHAGAAGRRLARLRLGRLLRGDGARGQVQVVDRTLQLLVRLLLLTLGPAAQRQRLAIRQAPRCRCRILRRALGSEPAAAERLLRARRRGESACHQHGGQCVSERREPQAAAQRGGPLRARVNVWDWALGSVKLGHGNGFLARE